MRSGRPRFELRRIYDDGTEDEPRIVPLTALPWETRAGRRGFFGASLSVATVLAALRAGAQPDRVEAGQVAGGPTDGGTPAQVAVPNLDVLAHRGRIGGLHFSADGQVLVSGGEDRQVKLWAVPDFTLAGTFPSQAAGVRALVGTPDAQRVVLSSNDGTARVLSRVDGQLIATVWGLTPFDSPLAVWSGSELLAYASDDDHVVIWSLAEQTGRQVLAEERAGARALASSSDGQLLIAGSRDDKIRVWSWADGALRATLDGHLGWVTGLAISQDGQLLASCGSSDKTVRLWDLPSRKMLASLPIDVEPRRLVMTPDGGLILVGAADGTIRVRSVRENRWLEPLNAFPSRGNSQTIELAVSPDGRWLASGDVTGVVLIWDLQTLAFRSLVFDPAASKAAGQVFTRTDVVTGEVIIFTLPCGSPIPDGAVCICNCVPGTYVAPPPPTSPPAPPGRGTTICTCDQVCVCIPVYR